MSPWERSGNRIHGHGPLTAAPHGTRAGDRCGRRARACLGTSGMDARKVLARKRCALRLLEERKNHILIHFLIQHLVCFSSSNHRSLPRDGWGRVPGGRRNAHERHRPSIRTWGRRRHEISLVGFETGAKFRRESCAGLHQHHARVGGDFELLSPIWSTLPRRLTSRPVVSRGGRVEHSLAETKRGFASSLGVLCAAARGRRAHRPIGWSWRHNPEGVDHRPLTPVLSTQQVEAPWSRDPASSLFEPRFFVANAYHTPTSLPRYAIV